MLSYSLRGICEAPRRTAGRILVSCHPTSMPLRGSDPNSQQIRTCRDELLVREMQSILAKFMKDSVVRGRMLQLLYEHRSEGSIPFGQAE